VARVITVSDDVAIRVSVVLKRSSETRAGAHVGPAVLLDRVKGVGADPDRMGKAVIPITLRQPLGIILAIHLQRQSKLSQRTLTGSSSSLFFRIGQGGQKK